MIEFIQIVILVTVWNLGLEIVLSEDMALHKVRLWAESKCGKIFEPLIICIWCRPSIHSIFGFIAALGLGWIDLSWRLLILYPFVVAGASFISGTLWSVYKLIEIKYGYLTHKEENEYLNLKQRKIDYNKNKK